MTAPVIHINGWPGTGKLTVARILAERLGARLLHNHLMIDGARALFARGTPESVALRDRLRDVLYDAALTLAPDVPLIITDALAETDRDSPLFTKTEELAGRRGVALVCVVLDISLEENLRRLGAPGRVGAKLTDPEVLRDLRGRHALMELPSAARIDVTDLSPDMAAEAIRAVVGP